MKIFIQLILFTIILSHCQAQNWSIELVGHLPEGVSNNAVSEAIYNDTLCIYSFGGIDSSLEYNGIHLRSYRYNTLTKKIYSLPDLPDERGKIAMSANRVGDYIYICGGYHVFKNGSEISSDKMHVFDVQKNRFIDDASSIPTPIDDHVQVVWKDSLIYLISGWSNTTNVNLVQIYNPSSNIWLKGTNTPNKHIYKSFGASGFIWNDTIYYFGGAQIGRNFPIQNALRKGIIDLEDPSKIVWSVSTPNKLFNGYRMAGINTDFGGHFIGGSNFTYNYNGKSYKDNNGVNPSNIIFNLDPHTMNLTIDSINGLPMDLRGIGRKNDSIFYLIGGMLKEQKTSNKILKLTRHKYITSIVNHNIHHKKPFLIHPNPSSKYIIVKLKDGYVDSNSNPYKIAIKDNNGMEILNIHNYRINESIDTQSLSSGIYYLSILANNKSSLYPFIINRH